MPHAHEEAYRSEPGAVGTGEAMPSYVRCTSGRCQDRFRARCCASESLDEVRGSAARCDVVVSRTRDRLAGRLACVEADLRNLQWVARSRRVAVAA